MSGIGPLRVKLPIGQQELRTEQTNSSSDLFKLDPNFFLKTLFCETDMLNIFRSYGYIFFDMFFWLKLLKLTLFGIDNAFSCLAIIITIIYFYVKKIHTLFTYILMHIATLERFFCLSLKIQTFMIWRLLL